MSTGPERRTRDLVVQRDQELCRRCLRFGEQVHHRRPRQAGGSKDSITNSPANLVLLCRSCHEWIESYRSVAYFDGWLIRRGDDPALVPLINIFGQTLWLSDDGNDQDGSASKQ